MSWKVLTWDTFEQDFQSWKPFISFKRRWSDESLTDDYIIRHSWTVSLWVSVTAGSAQVHSDPVLLDLCYLQELDVILCVWKLLQLSVSPPQITDLLLQSLQSSFSSTHCSLFLISDQSYQLRAASLNGADELSKDPLTVLHCCLCRALLGHTVIQLQWVWTETETNFSSSPDSPYETPQSLSAAEDLSLSAGFSAGASSASPSAASAGQTDDSESHRKLLALNHHVNRWIQ